MEVVTSLNTEGNMSKELMFSNQITTTAKSDFKEIKEL